METLQLTIFERIKRDAEITKARHYDRLDALTAEHFKAHPACAETIQPTMRMNRRWWKTSTLWQWQEGNILSRPTEGMAFNALASQTKVRDSGLYSVILNIYNIERYRRQKAESLRLYTTTARVRHQPYAQRPRRVIQSAW